MAYDPYASLARQTTDNCDISYSAYFSSRRWTSMANLSYFHLKLNATPFAYIAANSVLDR